MTAILEQEDQVLEQTAITVRDEAARILIKDQASYDLAAEKFRSVSALEKQIKDYHKPLKDKAHAAHKAICDAENGMLKPVTEAKRILSQSIGAWDDEQERIRIAEQRRLEEEARKRAEEEAISSAIEVEAEGGDAEEIEMILSTPAPTSRVLAPPTYSRSVATSKRWSAEAEGSEYAALLKLVKAAAENPAGYLSCLLPNTTEINRRAQAQKEAFCVPGYRARSTNNAVNRSAGGK